MIARTAANDDDDRDLIARIAAGDRSAFADFYDRHARRVLGFVRDLVPDAALAEDVTGDVMLAVWRGAKRFGGRSRVSTWVLGIAHHKAVDALRRRRIAPLPLETAELIAGSDDPEAIVIRAVDRASLDMAMAALTPDHREVLQLMYGFDRTQAEIAEIVDIPLATVKTRAFYAKRRLREALESLQHAEHIA